MSIPEKDELIINLKILSQLDKNRKLLTKETLLNIEPAKKILQVPESVRRWYSGNSRDETLKKIDNVIEKTITFIDKHVELRKYLLDSVVGIENLKATYSDCPQTRARLDVLLDKIRTCLKKYNIKIYSKDNKNDNGNFNYNTNSDDDNDTEESNITI